MPPTFHLIAALLLLAGATAAEPGATAPALPALWLCGDALVQLLPSDPLAAESAPLWSWDATTAPGLPEERRACFACIDEVKPVTCDGAPCVLITSSTSGGVALVRRSDQALLFSLALPMAHSAELLPGGWLVAAGSDGTDALVVQRVAAGPGAAGTFARHALPHAHGVVFEPAHQHLWADGAGLVRIYDWHDGALTPVRDLALPSGDAHDLVADPCGGGLLVATAAHVWRIDATSLAITPFAPLADQPGIKGLAIEATSGTLAYVQAEDHHWWSERVHVVAQGGVGRTLHLPGRQLYKVRWDQPGWLLR